MYSPLINGYYFQFRMLSILGAWGGSRAPFIGPWWPPLVCLFVQKNQCFTVLIRPRGVGSTGVNFQDCAQWCLGGHAELRPKNAKSLSDSQ